ncbi:Eukaryotic initiation factor 4E [Spironucleus salmonicida]|uniref:Eukaryotic initiation factor 4E n=1 Tax=Spironucleus salmonicida TaxID=348837 RepID=V6LH42_9EUKA|nr:Eukaryotic initiation factor 4E [Spironucleus salmonicida]|eukprot:EST43875.1 Eukaryotic initiation factor 4E [Spironucleus salmonicida]
MNNQLEFQVPLNLYYRGAFGKKAKNENIKTWNDNMQLITKRPITNSLDLFQILNMIPTFEEVHDGFSYFFFRENVKPDWDQHLDWFSMETIYEVTDLFASTQKAQWQDIKCQCEACIHNLLLIWCGSAYDSTSTLQGITIKIRRARITVSCWYSNSKHGEPLLTLLKQMFDQVNNQATLADSKDKIIRKYFTQALKEQQEESSRKSSKNSSRAGSRNQSANRSDRNQKSDSSKRNQVSKPRRLIQGAQDSSQ